MVTASLLLGILLVLLYIAYYFEKYLQSIASSLSEMNTQMQAFIEGASSAFELDAKDIKASFVSQHTLYWWAALGRRVYSNHGYWFHEHEEKSHEL
jgi:choline-glycine betaine transporter